MRGLISWRFLWGSRTARVGSGRDGLADEGEAGGLHGSADFRVGTVAERRGWMVNNLLNAANTAIGALLAVLVVRALSWSIG